MGIHKAILAPELVSRGAVPDVAVCYDVSAEAATDDEDFPQLVVREILHVAFDIHVAGFEYHVTAFAIVDRVENRLVAFVYPALCQSLANRSRSTRSCLCLKSCFLAWARVNKGERRC
jgi:hypothetical protein